MITALTQDQGNRLLEGTNKTLCTSAARRKKKCPHKRLSQTCLRVSRSLWQRRGSTVACCRVGALNTTVHAQVLLKEVAINLTIELPELPQDWGNRLLKGTDKPCAPGPRRKEQ